MQGVPTRVGYYIQSGSNLGGSNSNGPPSYQSPYLVSMGGDSLTNSRHSGAANVIRRGRNYLEDYKNQNSGYQVRLPKISNYKNQNNEYMLR